MSGDEKFTMFAYQDAELLALQTSYHGFFQIKTLSLRHKLFVGGWSRPLSRELFERGDAVGVLLFDPEQQQIALVEQFRIGPFYRQDQPWILELVAGMIEPGEAPEQVALRESQEEAGCVVQRLEPIAEYYASPGGSSEYFYLFCGQVTMDGVGGVHGLDHESEDIRVHVLALTEAFERLDAGEFRNAHTVIALQWLRIHGAELSQRWLQVAP